MEYSGKYQVLAEKLRAKGKPEAVIAAFIRRQMQEDAFLACSADSEPSAAAIWRAYPEAERKIWLKNAYCLRCSSPTQIQPDYRVKMDEKQGIVIVGKCAHCGCELERYCN